MGVTRKLLSATTLGLVDYRSDKERIARSTRKSHHELRRQTRLMRQQGSAAQVTVAVSSPSEPGQTLVERLVERPQDEAWMWTVFAVIFLIALFGHPGSLLFTLPFGVYLFWSRQHAARTRAAIEHEGLAVRADAAMADERPSGRHAR